MVGVFWMVVRWLGDSGEYHTSRGDADQGRGDPPSESGRGTGRMAASLLGTAEESESHGDGGNFKCGRNGVGEQDGLGLPGFWADGKTGGPRDGPDGRERSAQDHGPCDPLRRRTGNNDTGEDELRRADDGEEDAEQQRLLEVLSGDRDVDPGGGSEKEREAGGQPTGPAGTVGP